MAWLGLKDCTDKKIGAPCAPVFLSKVVNEYD
jgi:hypothetical protein